MCLIGFNTPEIKEWCWDVWCFSHVTKGKERSFWSAYLPEMNPTCTFSHCTANTQVQNDDMKIHLDQGKSAHELPPGRCYSLLSGIIQELFWNISWSKDKQVTVKGTVICCGISLSHQYEEKVVVCCPMACVCSVTMPDFIQTIIPWNRVSI